jgi:hypothetical protein
MIAYQTKESTLPGTSHREVYKVARALFKKIKNKTKRKPYIRSAYFRRQKVFFDYFWEHLHQKSKPDKFRRLKFFSAALEVVRHSRNDPHTEQNPNKLSELLHRFAGITMDKKKFYVQIKEHNVTKTKQLISIFPAE